MKRPTLIFAAVSLAAALAIAFAVREWHKARRLAAESEQRRTVRFDINRQLSAAEDVLREARLQTADLDRTLRIAKARPEPAPESVSEPKPVGSSATAALHARYMKAYRDNLVGQWGLLFQILGLSQGQIEQLKDLLTQREENDITVQQTAIRRGLEESSPEIQALDDELDRQNKAAIAALLGPDGYSQYRDYYHDRAVLPIVSDLAGDLFSTGTPLSAPQAQQLIGILADNSKKRDGSTVVKGTVNWDKAIGSTQAFLSPAQTAALGALRSQYEAEQQVAIYFINLANSAGTKGP